MSELFRSLTAASLVTLLHLPLALFLFSYQSSVNTDVVRSIAPDLSSKKLASAVAVPNLGVVEKVGPRTETRAEQTVTKPPMAAELAEQEDPTCDNIQTVSTANRVEPRQKTIERMSQDEQAEVLARYKMEVEQGKSEIRLELGSGVKVTDLANEFIIQGLNQTRVFDRWGFATQPTGSLQAAVALQDLPFNYRSTQLRVFGLADDDQYRASIIFSMKTEIEMYRSLFEYLKRIGLSAPRADWVYHAEINHRHPMFRWTDYSPKSSRSSSRRP